MCLVYRSVLCIGHVSCVQNLIRSVELTFIHCARVEVATSIRVCLLVGTAACAFVLQVETMFLTLFAPDCTTCMATRCATAHKRHTGTRIQGLHMPLLDTA
jgi:hypothetical protein